MAKKGKSRNKNSKREKRLLTYLIILTCLLIVIVFYAVRSYVSYHSLKSHMDYFRSNSSLEIQPWMTPHAVIRHFNITPEDLFNVLNTINSSSNLRKPISTLCSEKKENCTMIVEELNTKVR